MFCTAARHANHVHKPLIRFIGKRFQDSKPTPTGPHPMAPTDIKENFSSFLDHQRQPSSTSPQSNPKPSSSSSNSNSNSRVIVYDDISELPYSYIRPSQEEIELINVSFPVYLFLGLSCLF
ncbi:uncharacterized protein MELLADRAFT_112310 [Melampsora larici-populina 98AG31]|uniref:Uncharacterized protein n=1 Tax=Melampsora larici-populina (strain 98AG31 / pathotype 3-4-7) TaxID=747676 RepID=F4S630_MELLP|nr:uncharacterized protein MELLADRAFT_112310 [Melampsora larici-populina 98AG31]EGF99914.1 hypothetical protein MELLADRAFT_112310 [Melampsora larici-populina 98AG31]